MNPAADAALWATQAEALDAVLNLDRGQHFRVLALLAETAPMRVLAAIAEADS